MNSTIARESVLVGYVRQNDNESFSIEALSTLKQKVNTF